jgi:hypothetical protein
MADKSRSSEREEIDENNALQAAPSYVSPQFTRRGRNDEATTTICGSR